MQRQFTSLIKAGACVSLFLAAIALQAADASGTWTWTQAGRQGGAERKMTLKLKAEGENLTGTLTSPGREGQTSDVAIKDGKVKGDEISFSVTREFGGNSITMKYSGKVSGDTIKGKIETEREGQTRSRDWEAKRAEAK